MAIWNRLLILQTVMRSILSILLLAAYTLGMLQPIAPYLEYEVNRSYIIAELCENTDRPEMKCNGQCYLSKKLKQAKGAEENDPASPQPYQDYESNYSHTLTGDAPVSFNIDSENLLVDRRYLMPVEEDGSIDTPPPQELV